MMAAVLSLILGVAIFLYECAVNGIDPKTLGIFFILLSIVLLVSEKNAERNGE